MKIEMISTGDEILTGFITDTNATYLSAKLLDIHIKMTRRSTVGDNLESLVNIFEERGKEADIVIVNGGLGPTTDDLSAEAASLAMKEPLVLFEEAKNHLLSWYDSRNRQMPSNNIKQAYLPQSAQIIPNPNGTACGFVVRIKKALFFFTPGVPHEFKPMIENFVIPKILEHPLYVKASQEQVYRYFIFGIGESNLDKLLETINLPKSIHLGYRVDYPYLELKLISENATETEYTRTTTQIERLVGKYIIASDFFDFYESIGNSFFNQNVLIYDKSGLSLDLSDLLKVLHFNTYVSIKDEQKDSMEIFSNGAALAKVIYTFRVCIFKYPVGLNEVTDFFDDIFIISFYDKNNQELFSRTLKLHSKGATLKQLLSFTIADLMRRYALDLNPYVQYDTIKDYSPLNSDN